MVAPFKLKVHYANIGKVLKSQAMEELVTDVCDKIAAAAGDGHEVEVVQGRTRVRGSVRTATLDARIAEATDRNLSRALDAGRG